MKELLKDKSLFLVSITIALILPVTYFGFVIDPVLVPRLLLLSVLVLLLAVISIFKKSQREKKIIIGRKIVAVIIALTAFFVTNLVSCIHSINIVESIFELIKILNYILLLIFLISIVQKGRDSLSVLIKSVLVFSFVILTIACIQLIIAINSNDSSDISIRITSTLANKNLFSSAVFLTLPMSIYGTVCFTRLWQFVSSFIMTTSIFFILLLVSRAVWAAFAVSCVVLPICYISYLVLNKKSAGAIKLPAKKQYIYIASGIIVSLVLMFFLYIFSGLKIVHSAETKLSQIQNVISPDSDSRDASASQISKEKYPGSVATRLLLWKQSLGLVKQNPLFGVGAGNWKINFPKTGLNEFDYYVRQGNKHFQRPHNDFICVLCESGITGLLFYLTAYIMIIVFAIKSFFKEKSRNHRMLSVLLCAGLIGYLVISFFDFPVERITHNILICIYFAIILRLNPGTVHKEIIISRKSKYVFLVFCLVTGIFSIHVSRQRLKGEMYSNKLLHAQATQNWKVLIKEADNASSRYYSMDPFSTPVSWYKGVALFSLSRLNEAQAEFSKAYRQHPYHLQILNNLASCYEIKGNHVRSVELYRKALEISSGFEEAIVNLSIVYFNLGEIEKAFQTIQTNRISENPKYIIAIKAILAKKTEIIAQRQSNKWLADKIIAQTEDREKLRKIFEHSIIHNTSFEEEMLCTVKESK